MKKSKNPMAKLIASYKSDGPEPKTIYEKYLDHTANYYQQYGQARKRKSLWKAKQF
jgi:hypothetical protein